MQRSFFPGNVDYDGPMSRGFNSGRALSSHSLAVWRAALQPYICQASNVLDLGSGTGRFATLIAEWFGTAVIGVEPAWGMREGGSGFGKTCERVLRRRARRAGSAQRKISIRGPTVKRLSPRHG